ncbi:MAG: hypothetical protein Q8K58_13470 [Acidimicrobiales bacterium]|nr:hypothetical protein [Acidimicrobiales bacterium]
MSRRRSHLGPLVALVLAMLAAIVLGTAPPAGAQADPPARPTQRRVIVISVPGLTWEDVDDPSVPRLRALLDESAVANLATRVTTTVAGAGEAYLTLGAGTRAVANPALGGLAFDGQDTFGRGTVAQEHARQHGREPNGDVVALSWALLERANDDSEFGAEIGALGRALDEASISRGVVANADGTDALLPGEPTHREAALALADEDGTVPCGTVGDALLTPDPVAPYGVRLDEAAVMAQVERCSTPGSVVLVEASDLRRAAAFRPRATEPIADAAWRRALQSTDRLVGALLDDLDLDLDPESDAVVVVAPTTSPDPGLGVLGIRARELPPGLLTSGNTRQAGYALLTDVAPSIAALVGAELDDGGIEGRPVEADGRHGSAATRRHDLATGQDAALFRDRMLDPVVQALVVAISLLSLAAAAVFSRRWTGAVPWLERLALVLLAVPSMTYLAALFPFHDWGSVAYWAFLAAGSVAVGGVALALRRRSWLAPIVFSYGLLVVVVTASVVLLGSRLQLSTVFGDSPIVAGRFTGINNVTFALFAAAAIVLACAIVHLVPAPAGRRWMVALLCVVLLIDVAPMWGADVGGALAGLPALALVALGLGRWKVRWRTLALLTLATAALIVVLGVLDLSRESADRSHLGRLIERIGTDGSSGFTTVVERKLSANLRSLTTSAWRYVFIPVTLAAGLTAWRARERVVAVGRAFPPLVAALPGIGVAALLGYALNDSGIAVPGAMVAALVPGFVYFACRVDP